LNEPEGDAILAILPILTEGNPLLREKSVPVKKITKKHLKLIRDMVQTMKDANGVGLAAPQVGVLERIIVIDIGDGPFALINPEIVSMEGSERDVEGCLSVPGLNAYVTRAYRVAVKGLNPEGKPVRYEGEGLLARAFQHEIDHLDGILFIDYLADSNDSEGNKSK
jgi:peptide deformylase